jgi:hypothetical protein
VRSAFDVSWQPAVAVVTMAILSTIPCSTAVANPSSVEEINKQLVQELMKEADEYQAEGAHRDSAVAYAAAYDALAERPTSDAKETLAVNLAVDEFKLAQEEQPESLILLLQEVALLKRYAARRGGELPAELAKEQDRVISRIDGLRWTQEVATDARAARAEASRREAHRRAAAERYAAEQGESEAAPRPSDDVSTVNRPCACPQLDAAILGIGLASVVGGTALLANGLWNRGNVNRRGDELLATIGASAGGTPEARDSFRREVEAWQEPWRAIGTGLAVGGAVAAVAGIGLTTWGANRMVRRKRAVGRVSVLRPMISGDGVGVFLAGRY